MYTVYLDDKEIFEAKVSIKGASIAESKCRMILETEDWNFVFEGTLQSDGTCSIPIKKMDGFLKEGQVGTLKMEVIADNTYFVPWKDEFETQYRKAVVAEVKSKQPAKETSKVLVSVEVPKRDKVYEHLEKRYPEKTKKQIEELYNKAVSNLKNRK